MRVKIISSKKQATEAQIQSAFFVWLAVAYPDVRLCSMAIPNGGSRNIIEATNLKRQGVLKGVPDVFIAIPSHGYHGLWIEFKSATGKLSYEQISMIERLEKNGYLCETCNAWEKAKDIVTEYLKGSGYE